MYAISHSGEVGKVSPLSSKPSLFLALVNVSIASALIFSSFSNVRFLPFLHPFEFFLSLRFFPFFPPK